MTILVVTEHDNKSLHHATLHTIAAAKEIDPQITLLVIGYQCENVVKEGSQIQGVSEVLVCDHEVYKDLLAENLAQVLAILAKDFTHIFAPATTFGKDLLPRVAG